MYASSDSHCFGSQALDSFLNTLAGLNLDPNMGISEGLNLDWVKSRPKKSALSRTGVAMIDAVCASSFRVANCRVK